MPLLQQPEAYINGTDKLVDESGEVRSPETAKFLDNFIAAFTAWIERLTAGQPG